MHIFSIFQLVSFLAAVYDLTIGYKHRCPTFLDNVFGVAPSEVHIHIRRIPLSNIPISEPDSAAWLMETFRSKDNLLSDFYSEGQFPNPGTESELSTAKCLMNCVAVIALISTFTYLSLFSSIWFKFYVSLACTFLASATHFNIRPKPVLGLLKTMFVHKAAKC